MYYRTRHMVARRPFRYDRIELQPGDSFYATDVDSRYFISRGFASALEETASVNQQQAKAPVLDVSALIEEAKASETTLPAAAQTEESAETSAPDSASDEPQSSQPEEEGHGSPSIRTPRRRRSAHQKPEDE